jgi:hypothetical protein
MKPYIITGGTGFIEPSGKQLGVGQRIELADDVAATHRGILRELDADEMAAYKAEQEAAKADAPAPSAEPAAPAAEDAKPTTKGTDVALFGAAGAGGKVG